ncbi:DUF2971 domain-containing protein [Shewanella atlantica]|uniref:DUF2971 domain-containing protein n=1 Tax=Shewanella atlantica TaxID=271099 RepID=A0A3S0RPY4_9GAMM|nr:DUF2971 domain-containing protein [Shewanella atlantica]RTR33630.1 DUF2971 domain-containing protein [Shewanella atlantica]
MPLPPLYKYLNVMGAKLTLQNQCFRHAKPSTYNDTEDLTIRGVFDGELEDAWECLPEVLSDNLDKVLTCGFPMRDQVTAMQHAIRTRPDLVKVLQGAAHRQDEERYKEIVERHIEDINVLMQDYRVLCVTPKKNLEYMWSDYAEEHKGVMIRITPFIEKGSKFQLFKPVSYVEHRPVLYPSAKDFVEEALFGDKEALTRDKVERIIYTKTLEWEQEAEYRLAIALRAGEEPWETLPYHPEEITELHLGLEIEPEVRDELLSLAEGINPDVLVYQVKRIENGKLVSERVRPE